MSSSASAPTRARGTEGERVKVEELKLRRLQRVSRRAAILLVSFLSIVAASAFAEGGYTNHAGNVVAGWPVKLTTTQVSLAEGVVTNGCQLSTNDCRLTTSDNNFSTFQPFNFSTTNTYPLSIFPESERRRIAADFGQGRDRANALRRASARRRRATTSARSPQLRSETTSTSRSRRA